MFPRTGGGVTQARSTDGARFAMLVLATIALATLWRVAQLFLSPLQLYPDEAQYWLWSRRLDWGYYSKPPMIAWAIRASTALGGQAEAWVRLPAPLLHGGAAAGLFAAGRRLFDARTGAWAAAVYLLMPGVALSSQVIATDAPLLFFLALASWAGAAMWSEGGRSAAAALGAALGAAALSKYAAFYVVGGFVLHALMDAEGRRRLWTPARAALAAAAFLAVLAPNLIWNALHGFQTVAHTAADADLGREARAQRSVDLLRPFGFLGSQLGVFGPGPFIALAAAAVAWAGRRLEPRARWLLALTAPALVVVTIEASLARANANWAGAAYASGSLLAARTLTAGGRRWAAALKASLALQLVVAVAFSAAMILPDWVDALGLGNSLKRARGWREAAETARAWRETAASAGPVSAVAVDDRFLFNALAYYGRDWIASPGAPPLRMWVHEDKAQNQAEATAPLSVRDGGRVAFVSSTWREESGWDFARTQGGREVQVRLDTRRSRPLWLYVGEGFAPRPRDPVTGRPTPP